MWGWIIRALIGFGVSEGSAGALVAGKAFRLVAWVVIAVVAGVAGWGVLVLHDTRIRNAAADKATAVCVSETQVRALKLMSAAKDAALRRREARDQERAWELATAEAEAKKLGAENERLRKAAAQGGDGAVFPADDCWLRRDCRPHKGDAASRP